ncbi:MAG: hypothetical protein OEV49_11910 [candidate division Zixibacteria bacterium]|nr:hypothetical protein [candidate division Zixibacteria bacterium]MDH3936034.1 hypothetical protein [candidate division Zixibacteria bacterium]MDH4033816.1 hypothetical protein [candidate division Zixibacteria bacterium]
MHSFAKVKGPGGLICEYRESSVDVMACLMVTKDAIPAGFPVTNIDSIDWPIVQVLIGVTF